MLLVRRTCYMRTACSHATIYPGTLTLGLKGEARFYGSTARPEVIVYYMLTLPVVLTSSSVSSPRRNDVYFHECLLKYYIIGTTI